MRQAWLVRGLLIGFALVVAIAATVLAYDVYRSNSGITVGQIRTTGEARVGGPFTLTDPDGNTVTEKDFAGQFMLVFFGYTYCPDFWPNELTRMSEVMSELGEDGERIVPVFITIDPERDTQEAMREYVQAFHPRIVGLTGSPEAIAEAARAYRVYYKKAESEAYAEYLMDHSTLVYLMGPDGKFLQHFSPQTPFDRMVDLIRQNLSSAG